MDPILSNGYTVFFNQSGYDALNRWLSVKKPSSLFVICDANTNELCAPQFLSQLETESPVEIVEIEPGESMKTISTCVEIWNILNELGADRKSLVINLGGGVVTDLGGFAASVFRRGIGFVNVPTSLLGMVDASIGGKNGVDLGTLKNQIGTITSPEMVVIDSSFLKTLPQNEMRSGLAEMLKHGLIADADYWNSFKNLNDIAFDEFDVLIRRSVEIKNEIVMQDPTENGIRKALNFGHTIGHAIEGHFLSLEKPLLHGEAVAAGMIIESLIANKIGILEAKTCDEVKKTIKSTFADISFTDDDVNRMMDLLAFDKKNEYGAILFALIDKIGRVSIDCTADAEVIRQSFSDYGN